MRWKYESRFQKIWTRGSSVLRRASATHRLDPAERGSKSLRRRRRAPDGGSSKSTTPKTSSHPERGEFPGGPGEKLDAASKTPRSNTWRASGAFAWRKRKVVRVRIVQCGCNVQDIQHAKSGFTPPFGDDAFLNDETGQNDEDKKQQDNGEDHDVHVVVENLEERFRSC